MRLVEPTPAMVFEEPPVDVGPLLKIMREKPCSVEAASTANDLRNFLLMGRISESDRAVVREEIQKVKEDVIARGSKEMKVFFADEIPREAPPSEEELRKRQEESEARMERLRQLSTDFKERERLRKEAEEAEKRSIFQRTEGDPLNADTDLQEEEESPNWGESPPRSDVPPAPAQEKTAPEETDEDPGPPLTSDKGFDLQGLKDLVRKKSAQQASAPVPDPALKNGHAQGQVASGPMGYDAPPLGRPPKNELDGRARNIEDIMGMFPIGDGNYYVYVERKHPRAYRGVSIAGVQKPITTQMDYSEFAQTYGFGSYLLTVYGPKSYEKFDETGTVKRRPYTRPIRVDIADPYKDNPPNPEMADLSGGGGDYDGANSMLINPRRVGFGATEADASILKTQLEHESEAEERRRRWELEQEEREERRAQFEETRRKQAEMSTMGLVKDMLDQSREEVRELRRQQPNELSALKGLSEVLQAVKPAGVAEDKHYQEITRMRETHQRELENMRDSHRKEIDSIRSYHSEEITRVRGETNALIHEERRRADAAIKQREDDARRSVEDARNEASRRVQELTQMYEARLNDERQRAETRLNDERHQHQRDLQMRSETSKLENSTVHASFEMRMELQKQEVTRLTEELNKVRTELDKEKSKSLADRVNEFSGAAEALGFVKDDGDKGPRDWKDMLGEAAMGLVQQAPALASSVAGSLRGASMPMAAPPQMMQPMMPLQMAPPAFASAEVDMDMGRYTAPAPMPIYPGADPMGQVMPYPQAGAAQGPAMAQPMMVPVPAPVAQQAAPAGTGLQVTDAQIVEFATMFREALEDGAEPQEFSDEIVGQLGPIMSGGLVREISLERVTSVLQKAPSSGSDPLLRRDGQKFLKDVWEIVTKRTASK